MDDGCSLEEQLEQELLAPEEDLRSSVSTPRKRLEDARTMAVTTSGACLSADDAVGGPSTPVTEGEVDDSEASLEEATSILQRLSCALADNGEWEYFCEINSESQRTLTEMNATLGSLREWQKQLNVGLSSPTINGSEGAQKTAVQLLLRTSRPTVPAETVLSARDRTDNNQSAPVSHGIGADPEPSRKDNQRSIRIAAVGDEQDRLLLICQEQHIRAQQAAGRLQEQMQLMPRSRDDSGSTTNAGATTGKTPTKARDVAVLIRDLLARGEESESSSGNEQFSSSSEADGGGTLSDRVAELRRDVDDLQMREWIEDTRFNACDRARTLAREAGEDVRRGTGSDAVSEMEGELDGFANELDSLLLRMDGRGDGDGEEEEDEGLGGEGDGRDDEYNTATQHRRYLSEEGVAPAADAHVGRPVRQRMNGVESSGAIDIRAEQGRRK